MSVLCVELGNSLGPKEQRALMKEAQEYAEEALTRMPLPRLTRTPLPLW